MKRLATITLFAVTALCLFILANNANAEMYPGESPAPHILQLEELEQIAQRYWHNRGVSLPPVKISIVPTADIPAGATGEQPGNTVWISTYVLTHWITSHDPLSLENGCMLYLHERGHNAGFTHQAGWKVMRYVGGLTHSIGYCKQYAKDNSAGTYINRHSVVRYRNHHSWVYY